MLGTVFVSAFAFEMYENARSKVCMRLRSDTATVVSRPYRARSGMQQIGAYVDLMPVRREYETDNMLATMEGHQVQIYAEGGRR